MSLFPNSPVLGTRCCGISLSNEIRSKIVGGQYMAAADLIIVSAQPFNQIVRLLSNCPRALAAYFYKFTASITASVAQKQISSHLYVETQLGVLSSIQSKEREDEEKTLKQFISEYQSYLDPDTVIKLIKRYGEIVLLTEVCKTFKKNDLVIENSILDKVDIEDISKIVLELPTELQRQTFLRYIPQKKNELLRRIDGDDDKFKFKLSSLETLYDTLAIIVANIESTTFYKGPLCKVMKTLLDNGLFTKPIHFTMLLLLYILTDRNEDIKDFLMDKNCFSKANHDYIVSYCVSHGKYDLAAQIYARVDSMHLPAVHYMIRAVKEKLVNGKIDLKPLVSFFEKDLKDSKDLRECWLLTLREANNMVPKLEAKQWDVLVNKATSKRHLSLDDIFPLIPKEMPLDELHRTISSAVGESSKALIESEATREKIKSRMQEQRKILTESKMVPIEIDPSALNCAFCGQHVCDSGFNVYPCGHAVHISCFTANITSYISEIEYYFGGLNYEVYAKRFAKSCPACGITALSILDAKFVDPEDDKEFIEKWAVPQ